MHLDGGGGGSSAAAGAEEAYVSLRLCGSVADTIVRKIVRTPGESSESLY